MSPYRELAPPPARPRVAWWRRVVEAAVRVLPMHLGVFEEFQWYRRAMGGHWERIRQAEKLPGAWHWERRCCKASAWAKAPDFYGTWVECEDWP